MTERRILGRLREGIQRIHDGIISILPRLRRTSPTSTENQSFRGIGATIFSDKQREDRMPPDFFE